MNTSVPAEKPLLLFADDDSLTATYYRALLDRTFTVIYCDSVDQAVRFLRMSQPFAGFVIDMMMPQPSEDKDNETDDGMLSGIWLLKEARKGYPDAPAFILTNRVQDDIWELLEPYSPVHFARKLEFPPEEFEELVRSKM
jgi:ActR/RegA family two-component response regulator